MVVQQKLFITSYLAVLMLFAFSGPLTAQSTLDKEIDSLQTAIAKAAPDTAKINLHLAIIPKLYSRYLLNGNASADSLAFFQVINDCLLKYTTERCIRSWLQLYLVILFP
jgi:hypothetical protein